MMPGVNETKHGEVTRGIPTSYAAEPLKSEIAVSSDLPPVWPWHDGNTRGVGLEPLYKTSRMQHCAIPPSTSFRHW